MEFLNKNMQILVLALVFMAFGAVGSYAQKAEIPYTLEADEISYDDKAGKVTATGAVEIVNDGETVRADSMVYNQKTDSLTASGNVVYKDSSGHALLVEELTLTGGMKDATLKELRIRVPELGEILTAKLGSKQGNDYALEEAVYSPCKSCTAGQRPWQFRAKKVTYNADKSQIAYKHAVLDIYGVPVMYLPYFRHPIGTKKPQNGMLPPTFGNSTSLGSSMTNSYYYYSPEDNVDYTLRAKAMSSRGLMGVVERRQSTLATDSELKSSFIKDDRRDTWRGHLNLQGEYVLQAGRRFGINGTVSSDDTYLQDFFSRTDSYLPSTVYGEDASDDHYFGIYSTWYQDLETTRDPANTAQILPRIQFEKVWEADKSGGQFIINADAMALHRSVGIRSRRIVASGEYIKPWNFENGNRITFNTKLRGDFYNVDGAQGGDGNTIRGLPEASLKWEYPLLSKGGGHLITPIVMGVYAPPGGNPEDIPNEDSVAYELDYNNLFSTNRFAGLDRVENGPRIIYGIDNRWGSAQSVKWRFFLGQSWRSLDDDDLPASGGTEQKFSDWVGFAQAEPADWFSAKSLFRLDSEDFKAKRLDTEMRFGTQKGAHVNFVHTMLDEGPEELSIRASIPLSKRLLLTARTQRDIADGGRQLYGEVGLDYTYDCYRLTLLTRRRGFSTVDLTPSTDYIFNIQLLTLGKDSN